MKSGEKDYSVKEAMIFSQRIAQLSKALWKCVEKIGKCGLSLTI